MNILILFSGGDGFPIGGAYTNRVLALSKGLAGNGCKVTILIFYPGKKNIAEPEGVFDGIHYKFACNPVRPKSRVNKIFIGVQGIFQGCRYIMATYKREHYDALISFSSLFSQNFFMFLVSRLIKTPFIREKNEFPQAVLQKGINGLNGLDKIKLCYVYKIFDAFVLISTGLKNYLDNKTRKKSPVIIVPIVVDNERFLTSGEQQPEKLITYCGHLFGEKDGVKILLKTFSLIAGKHTDYSLMMIGDISDRHEFEKLSDYIRELGIEGRVVFPGFVDRKEIPGFLIKSAVLVLARPDNIQAKGGFPTKLGEYLATGRPVLVTSVSDIPHYIQHNVNGFLAVPGDADDFADKLDKILSDYATASAVGREGRKLADTSFNIYFQGHRLIDFINQVKTR